MLPSFTKKLILLRGLPGSGKTTFANLLTALSDDKNSIEQICADDCWETPYTKETFSIELHAKAHRICQLTVAGWMYNDIKIIVVHNTLTTRRELNDYYELAKKFGYEVHSLIVENRQDSESIHNVPKHQIEIMRERFDIKL